MPVPSLGSLIEHTLSEDKISTLTKHPDTLPTPRGDAPGNQRIGTRLSSLLSLNLGDECDRHCNVIGSQSRHVLSGNSNGARAIQQPASQTPQPVRFANYLPNSLHLAAFSCIYLHFLRFWKCH